MADTPVFQSISNEELKRALENGFDIGGTLVDDPVTREGYSELTPEDYETSWSDYGRTLAANTIGIGSSLARLSQYATDGAIGGDTAQYLEGLSEDQVRAMSPVARRALGAAFLPSDGEESVLDAGIGRSLALKTTAAVPSLVASIIPAGIATTLLRGASVGVRAGVGAGAARGTAGTLAAGEVVGQIYKKIDEFSDEELAKQSDVFAGYLTMMSPDEARAKYMRDVAGVAPIVAGAISAALGGVEGKIGRRLGGEAAEGFLKGVGKGSIAEALQEGAETGVGELLSQSALSTAGLDDMSWTKILSQTIEGMTVGGILGGGAGGISNIGGRTRTATEGKIPETDAGPLDPTTKFALDQETQTQQTQQTQPPAPLTGMGGVKFSDAPPPMTPDGQVVEPLLQEKAPLRPGMPTTEELVVRQFNENLTSGINEQGTAPAQKKAGYWSGELEKLLSNAGVQLNEQDRSSLNQRVVDVLNRTKDTAQRWAGLRQIVDELKAQKASAPAAAPQQTPDQAAMQAGIETLDGSNSVPERPATLQVQVKMLTNGERQAVYIPFTVPEAERPKKPKGIEKVFVKNGIVYYNPARLKPAYIRKADAADRLNDILPMGATPQFEAVKAVKERGAEPRVVQAIKDGISVLDVASSTETVVQDAAQVAAQAPADAEIVVRDDPEGVIQERIEGRQQDLAEIVVTPELRAKWEELGTRTLPDGRRVLPNLSDEGIIAAERQQLADQERQAQVERQRQEREERKAKAAEAAAKAEEKAKPVLEVKDAKESKKSKAKVAKKKDDLTKAKEIFEANKPTAAEDKAGLAAKRAMVIARVRKMLDEAKKAKIQIPGQWQAGVPEHLGFFLLMKKFAQRADKGKIDDAAVQLFLADEFFARIGEWESIKSTRRVEGDAQSKGKDFQEATGYDADTKERSEINIDRIAETTGETEDERVGRVSLDNEEENLNPTEAFEGFVDEEAVTEEVTPAAPVEEKIEDKLAARRAEGTFTKTEEAPAKKVVVEKRRKIDLSKIKLGRKLAPTKAEDLPQADPPEAPVKRIRTEREAFEAGYASAIDAMRANPDLKKSVEYAEWLKSLTDEQWAKIENVFSPNENPFLATGDFASEIGRARLEAVLNENTEQPAPKQPEPFQSMVQRVDVNGSTYFNLGNPKNGGFQFWLGARQFVLRYKGKEYSINTWDRRQGSYVLDQIDQTPLPVEMHQLARDWVNEKIPSNDAFEARLKEAEREMIDNYLAKNPEAAMAQNTEQPIREAQMPGQQEFSSLAEVVSANPDQLETIRELALEDDLLVSRDGQEIVPSAVGTVNDFFARTISDEKITNPLMRQLLPFMRRELKRLIGDMKVLVVSPEQMRQLTNKPNTGGFYTRYGTSDVIVIREDALARPEVMTYLMTHEGLHGATARGLDSNPEFFSTIKSIADEVRARMPEVAGMYGFTDQHEFVAELANPEFVDVLSKVTVSPELARKLGLKDWQDRTLWQTVVDAVRKLLKLPADRFTALDALMRTTAQAMEAQTTLPESFRTLPRGSFPNFASMDVARQAAQAIKDTAPGSIGKRRALLASSTLDQIRQWYRGMFVNQKGEDVLEKLVSNIQRIRPFADDKRERGEQLAQRFMDFASKNRAAANEFADIANSVTLLNANLFGENKHWGENRRDSWQARAMLPDLQRRFAALEKANPEARKLYEDMVAYYRDTQNEITRQLVDNILAEHDADLSDADRQSLTTKVMQGSLDEAAEKLVNNSTIFNALKDARQLRLIEGDYFPLMRHGEYVVQTKDSVGDTMGGKEVEPGVVEFTGSKKSDVLKMAEAFAKRTTKGQGFTQEDGVPLVMTGPTAVEMPSDSSQFKYRVKVQLDGVHMFDTQAEAESFIRDQKGKFAQISEAPLLKRDDGNFGEGFSNSSLAAIAKSISARDGIPQGQKEMMLTALKQAAVRHMAGNRVQKRSLPRRGFVGASSDLARNTLVYAEASTRYWGKLRYMPLVREAFTEMQKIVDAAKYSKNEQMLEQVLQHMRKRVDGNVIGEQETSPFIRDVMTLSYIDKLFSPAYSFLQIMQPTMMSLPYLGGRYGIGGAGNALAQAYRAVGAAGAMAGGLTNTKQAVLQFAKTAIDSTDVLGSMLKNVAKQPDGKSLTALLNELAERGAIDKNAGMEIAEVVTKGRGKWAMGLSKVDRIARQLPASIEQVNRAVTAIAAYRLAIENGATPEKAQSMAFDAVMNTQGDYSASNAPAIFNHPLWRISLQFKKYAQMYYAMFGDMLYRAFKDASPEERRVARKQLATVIGVQILAAGTLGIPGMEVIKIGFIAAAALGLGGGYDDFERDVREAAAAMFGKTAGELITKGVIPRALGIDLSTRLGADSLLTFGEPKKYDESNVGAYLLNTFIGAPGSLVADQFKAARAFADGEFAKGAQLLPMPKFLADTAKATQKAIEGSTSSKSGRQTEEPIGLGTAAINAFGLRTAEQAERSAAKGAGIAESERRRDAQGSMSKLKNQFAEAKNEGERVRILARLKELNAKLPEDQRQTPAQFKAFARRYQQDKAKGLIKDGARFRSEADRAASDRAGSVYNVGR